MTKLGNIKDKEREAKLMEIGIAIAVDRLIGTVEKFNPGNKFELQLTDAEMIRECAAVIANATEEQIIDALKEKIRRSR